MVTEVKSYHNNPNIMSEMEELPRCMVLFEEACRSKETFYSYKQYLKEFLRWIHKDAQSLLMMPEKELQDLLEDYIFYMKKKLNPNSIQPRYSGIAKFLKVNSKGYDKERIKMFLPEKVKTTQGKAWETKHIQKMLQYADTARAKALIHFLSASGCRIGAMEGLRLKHIEKIDDCYSLKLYPGGKWEYISFLHPEATMALDEYIHQRELEGEKITTESPVFRSNYGVASTIRPQCLGKKGAQAIIMRVLERAKIYRMREDNSPRFEIALDTGFRKRFNTILKTNPNISYAIAERLMDHRTNLEQFYLDTPRDALFTEYKKAITDMMIDDSERLRHKNRQLEDERSEFEKRALEIKQQKDELTLLKIEMEKVKLRLDRTRNLKQVRK